MMPTTGDTMRSRGLRRVATATVTGRRGEKDAHRSHCYASLVGSLWRNQLPNANWRGWRERHLENRCRSLHCLSYLFLRAASLASISTAEESVSSSAN